MDALASVSIYQWLTTAFSLVYIFFAVRNKKICFLFGFIASVIWAYEDFAYLNLKFDGLLQVFYAFVSLAGILSWSRFDQDNKKVRLLPRSAHGLIIIGGTILGLSLGYVAQIYWNTNLPYLDSLTTGFSIFATFLLVGRYLENWLYWIVIDLTYMYIFWKAGGFLFVFIMAIFTVMAVQGYISWKKEWLTLHGGT